jgi:hypothetical protein
MDIKEVNKSKNNSGPLYQDWANPSLDEILRGEYAAIETYKECISYLKEDKFVSEALTELKDSHNSAVLYWKTHARISDKIPQENSGLWGVMVGGMLSLSKLGGPKACLSLLKEGEEHGLELYKKMLKDENIDRQQKADIKTVFIPNQKKHIQFLDNLMKALPN